MSTVTPEDALQEEESNIIPFSPRCEGKNHPAEVFGHEGPAAWIVTAVCPSCGWADVVLLCDGRVQWIIDRDGDFTCGSCAGTMHWTECWTLAPIGGAQ
ncbi:hypothetical protein P2P98_14075 [Microbacterium sp. Kw_RZR3]|uniref:hypothetical protein n=1 Tax=Microbacterium sp. Kw_RZR3 TaxID=3032903 RepID=UPI0023DA4F31|nr:hypothetical protein [Microbacterium sp. Kw_RZR3]MDF2047290.1 hypothetical protein [Microbacterium sp. Kw_RZR3]